MKNRKETKSRTEITYFSYISIILRHISAQYNTANVFTNRSYARNRFPISLQMSAVCKNVRKDEVKPIKGFFAIGHSVSESIGILFSFTF